MPLGFDVILYAILDPFLREPRSKNPGLKYSFLVSMVTEEGICLFLPLDWNSSATRRFTSKRISVKCSFDTCSYIVSTNALMNHEPYSELRQLTYPGTVQCARTKSASTGSALPEDKGLVT